MKPCKQCGEDKDPSEYYKSKNMKSGLYPECKICCRLNAKVYWSEKKNDPEVIRKNRARAKKHYDSMKFDPEFIRKNNLKGVRQRERRKGLEIKDD